MNFRYTCNLKKQLVKLKATNDFVDDVKVTCQAGGRWSHNIQDYKCLGIL